MAEAIEAHEDAVMRSDRLLGRVISLDHRVVVIGDLEFGMIESIRFITQQDLDIAARGMALIDRSPSCIDFSTARPRPHVAQQRRAVRAGEKARRKTMPRGRR